MPSRLTFLYSCNILQSRFRQERNEIPPEQIRRSSICATAGICQGPGAVHMRPQLHTNIPNYAEVAAPLLGFQVCYAEVAGRNRKKLRQLSLTPKWGPT
jgi:hypothetical protein